MKGIKRLAVYSTIGALALTNLTGCLGKKEDKEVVEVPKTEEEIYNENTALEQLNEIVNEGETRIFEPYQHLFFIRVNLYKESDRGFPENITAGSINTPEDYKILEIENFNMHVGSGSQTAGYDIWFTNEVPVEVTAIYNEELEKYDYSHFGIPVAEKETEETIQKTK